MRVVYTKFNSLFVLREHADQVLPTVKLPTSCSDVTCGQARGHTGPDWREDGREREEGRSCVGSRGALGLPHTLHPMLPHIIPYTLLTQRCYSYRCVYTYRYGGAAGAEEGDEEEEEDEKDEKEDEDEDEEVEGTGGEGRGGGGQDVWGASGKAGKKKQEDVRSGPRSAKEGKGKGRCWECNAHHISGIKCRSVRWILLSFL
jgi:hypothetical protein